MAKGITEFLCQTFKPQREFMGPWFRSGEMVLCYAPRGTGKSLFAMSLAYAISIGEAFLGFRPQAKARALYVEAEMPQRLTATRLGRIEAAAGLSADPEFFLIETRDENGNLPNLSTPEGQKHYAALAQKADVIVIDNLTTAAPPINGRDDDVQIWYRLKPFLYSLRNADKCIVLIHHAGKSGQQLGTSLRENDMDIILRLTTPPHERTKTAMYLDVEKARDLPPEMRRSMYIEYEVIDGQPMWTHQDAHAHRVAEIKRLSKNIKGKQVIASMLNCPVWEVYQALREESEVPHWSESTEGDDDGYF